MCVSRRARLSWDGSIKGACVEHSVSYTSSQAILYCLESLQQSQVNCLSLEHIQNTLFCEPESPVSSIKGPFVFGYLFMDLFTSSLKMMSDPSTSRNVLCIMNEWSHELYKPQPDGSPQRFPTMLSLI